MAVIPHRKRLIVVGQSPGKGGGGRPLWPSGAAVKRLLEWARVSPRDWVLKTHRLNVTDRPGAVPTAAEVAECATRLSFDYVSSGCHVLLLGRCAARVLDMRALWQWTPVYWYAPSASVAFWAAAVPHPSGRSHVYNNVAVRHKTGKFVAEALAMVRP